MFSIDPSPGHNFEFNSRVMSKLMGCWNIKNVFIINTDNSLALLWEWRQHWWFYVEKWEYGVNILWQFMSCELIRKSLIISCAPGSDPSPQFITKSDLWSSAMTLELFGGPGFKGLNPEIQQNVSGLYYDVTFSFLSRICNISRFWMKD